MASVGSSFEGANKLTSNGAGRVQRQRLLEPLTQARRGLRIAVLGGFSIVQGDTEVEVASGRPTTLVKLLAVSGGCLPAADAAEALWPDADPGTGRRRLRNVLNRLKGPHGSIADRHGLELRLPATAMIDAAEFEREARAALYGSAGIDAAAARQALDRFRGELLPGEQADWIGPHRERLRALAVELLDRLAEAAEAREDFGEAIRLLRRAADTDRFDERRYLLLASLLAQQDRRGAALRALQEGTQALADLGLEPSEAYRTLAKRLRDPRGVSRSVPAQLPVSDYEATLELLGEIHESQTHHELRVLLVTALRRLAPADYVAINEMYAGGRPGPYLVEPELPGELLPTWNRLAHTNPLLKRYLATHDGRPYRFSDVLSREELEALPIYQEFYLPLGVHYQIAFTLPAPRDVTVAVVLSRGTPDFTDRERALLDLARPHIIQAYRNAHQRARPVDGS
jgi:DNA-binding SARP family transcriptional activator